MTVLLLRLAGPMQSWGTSSRFARRDTGKEPTKSGVLGLLAAALGRRRTDPLEDLLGLSLGVRVEQEGRLLRDFQTARPLVGKPLPLTYRFYLADAVFLAAVEGDDAFLEGLNDALRHPQFPLFLGRRSCPPVGPVTLGHREGDLRGVLASEPWQAAGWWKKKTRSTPVHLRVCADSLDGEPGDLCADVPLSFDPERREFGLRRVTRYTVRVTNDQARLTPAQVEHDPMSALGGA